jgi:hypothetical protein
LKGGLDARERHGYPLEPLTLQTEAVDEPSSLSGSTLEADDAVTLRALLRNSMRRIRSASIKTFNEGAQFTSQEQGRAF